MTSHPSHRRVETPLARDGSPVHRRLLHLIPLAVVGGCEVNCRRLIEALPDDVHRVLVFDTSGPMVEQWRAAGATVEVLGAWRGSAAIFHRALEDWAAQQPGAPAEAIVYWSTSRLPIVRKALQSWSLPWAVHLGNPVDQSLRARMRRQWQDWCEGPERDVTLVACSRYVALSYLAAGYFRRFPCRVVYNAVPPFPSVREGADRRGPKEPVVGMIARLDRIKDHRTLIHAMAEVRRELPRVVLELAGDGELRAGLEREAARVGVAEGVRFLGFTPIEPLLPRWSLYAHSTTDAEGMGTAVAEAMMAGLPCIVSDLRVMREVCGPEQVRYVRAGDAHAWAKAIVGLLRAPETSRRFGEAARRRAQEQFSTERFARGYADVLFGGKRAP